MQVSIQKLSDILLELAIEIPADQVRGELESATQRLTKSAAVPGFRRGKIPSDVISRMFGAQLANDVAQKLINDSFQNALTQNNIVALQYELQQGKVHPEQPFVYRARVEVPPQIDSVKYDGFKARRVRKQITDTMLEQLLESFRQQHSTLKAPEPPRPAKEGDTVTFDFVLTIQGKPVRDGRAEGHEVVLGSPSLLKELNSALIGMSVGETASVEAHFGPGHKREDFRNKTGLFQVKLSSLKERVLPELTDELAKQAPGVSTVAELREYLKGQGEKMLQQEMEEDLARQLITELVNANPVTAPPSLVQRQFDASIDELKKVAQQQQIPFQLSEQEQRALSLEAVTKVRAGLLVAGISRLNGMVVTNEDFENAYKELAEESGKNIARIRADYREPEQRNVLTAMILEDKVLKLIEEKSEITDMTEEEAKAAATAASSTAAPTEAATAPAP